MKKSSTQGKKLGLSKRKALAFGMVAIFIISSVSIISLTLFKPQPVFFSTNAVIIDELALDSPDSTFVNSVTTMLGNSGFNVSYVCNESVTVNFFSELAKDNYGIIILRTHTAMREQGKTVDIFTSQPYSPTLYTQDQNQNPPLLVKGILNYSGEHDYFAVTSEFINDLGGSFPKSIVFMMGCWSLMPGYDQVAQAFISKGAEVCTGWTNTVLPAATDAQTIKLINAMVQGSNVGDAVLYYTQPQFYNNDTIKSEIGLYPTTAAGLTLSYLLSQTRNSAALQAVVPKFTILRRDWLISLFA